jgi:hypothetical protein
MKALYYLSICLLLAISTQAQQVHFNFTDGNQSSYGLQDVSQITFSGEMLNLEMEGGTIYSWNINTITNFMYSGTSTGVDEALSSLNSLNLNLHPNPTDSNLKLTYNLKENARLNVAIHSVDGKLVKQLFDGEQRAGEQIMDADLSDLNAGVYICRISSNDFAVSKKLLLN